LSARPAGGTLEVMTSSAAPVLVLIHSPLVGPLTWQPAAERLRARGLTVVVPSLAGAADSGPPYYPRLAARVAEAVRAARPEGSLVLVGHSGAGPLLPAVAAACGGEAGAAVFVDAGLPHPGASWLETAPSALGEHLRRLAAGGRLPPWNEWFPPEALTPLLPDPDQRARFVAELPRLPVGYLEEPAPPGAAPARRCAYLQLSAPYGPAADEAKRRGWPTLREEGDHLAPLTRPAWIAGRLTVLVDRLAPGGQLDLPSDQV
jgi:hypothetical protein